WRISPKNSACMMSIADSVPPGWPLAAAVMAVRLSMRRSKARLLREDNVSGSLGIDGSAVFPTKVGPSSEKRVSARLAAQNSRRVVIGSVVSKSDSRVSVHPVAQSGRRVEAAPRPMAEDPPGGPPRPEIELNQPAGRGVGYLGPALAW